MKIRLVCAVLLGALALLVSACGSSSSSGASSSASASSSGQSQSATPQTGSAGTSPAASAQAAGPSPCATANLQVKLGASSGAAGSVYIPIVFTNTGSAGCTLYGYPGVSLAGGSPSAQIGAAADRNPSNPATLVTLAPGGTANATLQVAVAGNYPTATCGPTPASTLVIYPPNQTASVSVPYSTTGCSSQKITILHVGVVQSGSGG